MKTSCVCLDTAAVDSSVSQCFLSVSCDLLLHPNPMVPLRACHTTQVAQSSYGHHPWMTSSHACLSSFLVHFYTKSTVNLSIFFTLSPSSETGLMTLTF